MKVFFISTSASPAKKYKKGDRLVVKFDKDDWYLGTVSKVAAGKVYIDFDDGDQQERSENYSAMYKVPDEIKKRKKFLTDAQAKGLKEVETKSVLKKATTSKIEPKTKVNHFGGAVTEVSSLIGVKLNHNGFYQTLDGKTEHKKWIKALISNGWESEKLPKRKWDVGFEGTAIDVVFRKPDYVKVEVKITIIGESHAIIYVYDVRS